MQFTALPGRAAYPALSPDGSRIAFAWNAGEESGSKGFDLYVKAIGSENLQRLTNDSSGLLAPAWSPDGAEIAFQRLSQDQSGIYLVPAQGGPERKLHSTNPSFGLSLTVSWSPDGKSIAFADSPVSGGHRRLHLLSLETLESTQIEHNEACLDEGGPAFSHDGGQLAYACYTASGDFGLLVATSSGAIPRLVKAFPDYVESPVWASGDKRLIFEQGGDHNSVRELTIADGSIRDLPLGEDAENPTISATGEKIAYDVRSFGNHSIWRSDLLHPQAEPVQLISTSREEVCPQYSPNGKHIAFASNRSGPFEMWVSDSNGKNVVQLTNLKNPSSGTPSWSPDSHKIVFDSRISVQPDQYHADLYIVDIAERVPRKLILDTGEASMPSWSHDGKWIYFIGGGRGGGERIYRVPPEGGHTTAISMARGHFPLESFDGQSVYFEVPPGFLQVASLKPTGTESRVEGMPQLAGFMNWTIVRGGIYFFPERDPLLLSYYDFATKRVGPVFRVGAGVDVEASVSPDNRYIIYSEFKLRSDIMLVDHFR
jgi:Tol biopolymer transport system component